MKKHLDSRAKLTLSRETVCKLQPVASNKLEQVAGGPCLRSVATQWTTKTCPASSG
jgi:hypothetical protein